MRKSLLFLCLLAISTLAFAQPNSGLEARYNFTNGSLGDAANGNNLTQTGTALTSENDRFGITNNAISLTGDFLSRPDIAFPNDPFNYGNTGTVSLWVKSNTNDANERVIYNDAQNRADQADNDWTGHYIYLKDGKIGAGIQHRFQNTLVGIRGGKTLSERNINDGLWHHVVFTFESTLSSSPSGQTDFGRLIGQLFIDGVNDSQVNVNQSFSAFIAPGSAMGQPHDQNGPIKIAQNFSENLPATEVYEDGIDDINIYTRILTPVEIVNTGQASGFCLPPNSNLLSAVNTMNNATDLNIAGFSGQNYDIAYHKANEAFSAATIIATVNASNPVTGLDANTDYVAYLREDCTNNTSAWSPAIPFTTTRTIGRIYVDVDATGGNNGSDWANAYNRIEDAVNLVTANEEIWVAEGTYTADVVIQNRLTTILFDEDGVSVYGGFAGTETAIDQRIIGQNETIFSGDLLGNDLQNVDFNETTRGENTMNVVWIEADNITLDGLTISGGFANANPGVRKLGAGIYKEFTATNLTINQCIIKDNVADDGAGGLYFRQEANAAGSGFLKITNTIFQNNLSVYGAGIYSYVNGGFTLNIEISNCIFNGNVTKNRGTNEGFAGSSAWIRSIGSTSTLNLDLINNVHVNNEDLAVRAGINNFTRTTLGIGQTNGVFNANVANSIFYENSNPAGNNAVSISSVIDTISDIITVKNSIDADGFSNIPAQDQTSNITSNPLFTDFANADFSLQATSPAVDSGDNASVVYPLDFNNNSRQFNGTVDMGAFELNSVPPTTVTLTINAPVGNGTTSPVAGTYTFTQNENVNIEAIPDANWFFAGWSGDLVSSSLMETIQMSTDKIITATFTNVAPPIFVDVDATGNNDGTSWANAFNTIQAALTSAGSPSSITQIWIAEGIYKPGTANTATYTLPSNIELYGGFDGTETIISERDFRANQTILDGDLNGDDANNTPDRPVTRTDNARSIITITGNDTFIDGFTIQNGYAAGNSLESNNGAAIFKVQAVRRMTVKNCIIQDNYATSSAAGIFAFFEGSGFIRSYNNQFLNNRAGWGTGLYVVTVGNNAMSVFANVYNNLFADNIAGNFNAGGGFSGSAMWFRSLAGNGATLNANIVNNTITRSQDDGIDPSVVTHTPIGIEQANNAQIRTNFYNNIVWNNTGTNGVPTAPISNVVNNSPGSVLVVSNSVINMALIPAAASNATSTIVADPLFTNGNNDFTLQNNSPAIEHGSNSLLPTILTQDLAGNQRIFGTNVDAGAYESQSVITTVTLTATTVGSGTVTPASGTTYNSGDTANLTANPDTGWQFDGWSGDLTSTNATETLLMDADKTVTATFSQIQFDLTVNVLGNGTVTPTTGTSFNSGDTANLTATPDTGWQFDGWSGDLTSTDATETLLMDADKTVTATFSEIDYAINVSIINGSGTVTISPAAPYNIGDVVTISATADTNWQFEGYSGDISSTVNPFTFTLGAQNYDIDLSFDSTLGLTSFTKSNLKLYPNPASSSITIQSDINLKKVDMYNAVGAKVITTTNTKINVSHLSSGLYMIKVEGDQGQTASLKFIKQ